MDDMPPTDETVQIATSFQLRDNRGELRAELGLREGVPVLVFFDDARRERVSISLSASGLPQLRMWDGSSKADPLLSVEEDALGCHVLMSGRGEQKTYLFLKKTGATGIVMINSAGQRQGEWTLGPDGAVSWALHDQAGTLLARNP
jgi:hypothetical protein